MAAKEVLIIRTFRHLLRRGEIKLRRDAAAQERRDGPIAFIAMNPAAAEIILRQSLQRPALRKSPACAPAPETAWRPGCRSHRTRHPSPHPTASGPWRPPQRPRSAYRTTRTRSAWTCLEASSAPRPKGAQFPIIVIVFWTQVELFCRVQIGAPTNLLERARRPTRSPYRARFLLQTLRSTLKKGVAHASARRKTQREKETLSHAQDLHGDRAHAL